MSQKKSTPARRKPARKMTERPVSPAVRMGAILKHYNEHANPLPSNPLVTRKTPLEAIKSCQQLAEWLALTSMFSTDQLGRAPAEVYLMLSAALGAIHSQLLPLFNCAHDVAEGGAS